MPAYFERRLRALVPIVLSVPAAACGSHGIESVPVELTVDHRFGDVPVVLGSAAPVVVTRLGYYLGQFRLQAADGQWVASTRRDEPDGDYVRIDLAEPSTLRFSPLSVPSGEYRALEFLIGVDARRNGGGAQKGALDPEHGLFWTWNTGYIFFALEGRSPGSGGPDHALTYHLGGDSKLARTVVLPLSLQVEGSDSNAALTLRVDLAEFFRDLPLERTHTVMSPKEAAPLADRYADLFSVRIADAR